MNREQRSLQETDTEDSEFEVFEEDGPQGRPRRGVFLLPNLFTTGALFAGFYAILAAFNGDFAQAAIAVLIAGILDGMDGGVARLTNTQSRFGAEYDSLSDCVAFGVAPALVAWSWGLSELGNVGWAAAFIYLACGALRLARFNVGRGGDEDKRYFTGLPSPSGAGLVATMVWLGASRGIEGHDIAWLVAGVTVVAALLMVSSIPYNSFKELRIGRVPFRVLLGVIVLLAIVFIDPPLVLLVAAVLYVSSGPVVALWLHWRKPERVSAED